MRTLFNNLGLADEVLLATHNIDETFELIRMVKEEGQEHHRKNIVFA
jgi:hypothetical protein